MSFFRQNISPVVLNGLVGWWRLDETSGTVAKDSSIYGNHGSLIGTPIWSAGNSRGGLLLNGTTDYVRIEDNPKFLLSKNLIYVHRSPTLHEIYINGILDNQTVDSFSIFNSAQPLFIGASLSSSVPSSFFKGIIGDVRLYNRGISPAEVSLLYQASI